MGTPVRSEASRVARIANVSAVLWLRELSSVLRLRERQVVALGALIMALAAAVGTLLGLASSAQVSQDLPVELRAVLLRTAFAGAAITAAAVAAVLCSSLPPRTALRHLLELLPVSRLTAVLGQLFPVLLVTFGLAVVLSGTPLAIQWRMQRDPLLAVLDTAGLMVLLGVLVLLSVAGYSAVEALSGRYLPTHYAAAVAMVSTIGLALITAGPELIAVGPAPAGLWDPRQLTPHLLASTALSTGGAGYWLGLPIWTSIGLGLLAVAGWAGRTSCLTVSVRWLTGSRPRRGPWWTSAWAESLIAVRAPQFVVALLLIPFGFMLALWLSRTPQLADVARALAHLMLAVPFAHALYAVGRTYRFRWLADHLSARPSGWVWPKLVAYLAIGSLLAVPLAGVAIALGLLAAAELGTALPQALAFGAICLLAGALIPYSEEQPLSMTAAGFLSALLSLSAGLLVSWTGQMIPHAVQVWAWPAVLATVLAGFVAAARAQGRAVARV